MRNEFFNVIINKRFHFICLEEIRFRLSFGLETGVRLKNNFALEANDLSNTYVLHEDGHVYVLVFFGVCELFPVLF